MDTIRIYKNNVILGFEEHGSDFSLDVPHYNKWKSIISFLTRRGFTIRENQHYKVQYKSLSKFHKIGFKKDVALLMEIGASTIKMEFGSIKNLWVDCAQAFWDNPSDDRYTKLPYLEGIAVLLEIKRIVDYCKRWGMAVNDQRIDLSPEQYIIGSLKNNTHIHGKVTCLNDIKVSIKEDSYDYQHNSDDQNKKKIISGETKYFYDPYTKRLSCGVVWHHINNMWWVISSGRLMNIVCWDYFDFHPDLPKRKPPTQSKINSLLKKYESERDYDRCKHIHRFHKKLLTPTYLKTEVA